MTADAADSTAPGGGAVLVRRLRGDDAWAQLVRFAAVGGLSNILYVGAFVALREHSSLIANAVGVVISTVLANELHRRLTFHAQDRVGWFTAQWEAGGLALIGLGATSAAVAAMNVTMTETDTVLAAAVVVGVTAVVGLLRFLALRGWVFRRAWRPRS